MLFIFSKGVFPMPQTNFSDIMDLSIGSISLGSVFSAILTLLICLLVIRAVTKVLKRLLSKTRIDPRVQNYVSAGTKAVLYIIAGLIVVDSLGIPITSLVALLSVGSLGITLAAEDILGNVAGGLVILSSHPFSIGDFVEVGGTSGTVKEISLNHTKLETPDGLLVMLPNQELASSQVTNYTALGRRRVVRKITASYDAPTENVMAACRDALAATPYLLSDPDPVVRLTDYGASSIEYTIFCWTEAEHYWDVYHTLNENLRGAFDAHKVEMTYDHLNVHIVENRG